MAVYTPVDDGSLRAFLDRYDLGTPVSFKGIAEGVENTNYLVETTQAKAILTLYEKRVNPDDLPFFLEVMAHLAAAGLPAALPIADRNGTTLQTLKDKPAALISFVPGISPDDPSEDDCGALGDILARMHLAMDGFDKMRPNALSIDGWRALAGRCTDAALNKIAPGLGAKIEDTLFDLVDRWPAHATQGLPTGVIHADLFPDNVMLGPKGTITGIIDLYFACTDFYAYDLSICINAWCFDQDHRFSPAAANRLLTAYQNVRPLTVGETDHLPLFARGAALRFLLTRAYDWLHQTPGAVVRVKDPGEYIARLDYLTESGDALRTIAMATAGNKST
ncbi:MAG: homoserine kinase, partial [Pseudomonadota bacterium]